MRQRLVGMRGAILLIEELNKPIGLLDRQLTMLRKSECLDGVCGVAVGQYIQCGSSTVEAEEQRVFDLLREHFGSLGVPILGGLPIGHGAHPVAVPIGTEAILDADSGLLRVSAAVQ